MTTSSAAVASLTERELAIGGRAHRVLERRGSGPVVIALHGANVHAGLFAPLFTALDPALALHAPDQPGRRMTEDLLSRTIADRAAFVEAVIASLGLVRPIIVGHSLGGAVALELAARSSVRLAGLVLCSTGFRFEIAQATLDELRALAATGGRRRANAGSFSPACRAADVAWVDAIYQTIPAASALADYECLGAWNGERLLGDVSCPTLIVRGSDEFAVLEAQCETMARTIPGARSTIIPGAGHMLPVVRPQALAAAISELVATSRS